MVLFTVYRCCNTSWEC